MARNAKNRGDGVPRVYDKSSGEYRPVFDRRAGAQTSRRSARYATPQRRAEARRRRRRRALLVFYLFVFITVITAAVALSLTVLFKIDSISVTGTTRYSAEQVVQAGGIRQGENLFLANTGAARQKIQQKLPYVASAQVSRRLPAKIVISITEEPICGVLEYKGKYAVVGTSGKVLDIAAKRPEGNTLIKGLPLSSAETGKQVVYADASQRTAFQELTAAISGVKLDKITELDFTNPYQLRVVYDGRIVMNLGPASELEKKLLFGKRVLESGKIKDTEKGVLDLSTAAEDEHAYFDPSYAASSASAP